MSPNNLADTAKNIRRTVLEMIHRARSSHIGSAYSIIDILTVLYFDVMNIDPQNPEMENRDVFLLSKGHACTAIYATLAHRGFFPIEKLEEYGTNGTTIAGHVSFKALPGIEATAGSLGHGLPMGMGIALAAKKDNTPEHVYVLVGDGECNEGSIWEAALGAPHFNLDNLTVIVDVNKQQGMGHTKEVLDIHCLEEKWRAFGWNTIEVDGHNVDALSDAFKKKFDNQKPTVIIADTVKGKGVEMMEDNIYWHYKPPTEEQYQQALSELE